MFQPRVIVRASLLSVPCSLLSKPTLACCARPVGQGRRADEIGLGNKPAPADAWPHRAIALCARRIALERRQFMGPLHPTNAIGDLDVRPRRNSVGIVIGRTLNIDNPRQHLRVGEEKAGATVRAEMPATMLRGGVHFGSACGHLDQVERIHGPGNHRRTSMTPAIRAMTEGVGKCITPHLIADRTTVTAASDGHLFLLTSAAREAPHPPRDLRCRQQPPDRPSLTKTTLRSNNASAGRSPLPSAPGAPPQPGRWPPSNRPRLAAPSIAACKFQVSTAALPCKAKFAIGKRQEWSTNGPGSVPPALGRSVSHP